MAGMLLEHRGVCGDVLISIGFEFQSCHQMAAQLSELKVLEQP